MHKNALHYRTLIAGLLLSGSVFAADPQVSLKTTMGEIVVELNKVLHEGADPRAAVAALMRRPISSEPG